ncbi:MAG: hypothetical protein ACOY94_18745 [Bacillota bacterium]
MTIAVEGRLRRRDVTLLDLPGGGRLLVACDAAGGIGPKAHDTISVPGSVLGRFTARVALMEVIAAGGRPILLVNTACVEPAPAGSEILDGIREEAALAGLGPDAITGSFETNIPTSQTGLGVTALAVAAEPGPTGAHAGDLILAIGRPKVGPEVSLTDPEIADLPLVRWLAAQPPVHDLLPVGSRGIAAEAADLAATNGLDLDWLDAEEGWDLAKSAGPATTVLAAVAPGALPALALSLDRPWSLIARLTAKN